MPRPVSGFFPRRLAGMRSTIPAILLLALGACASYQPLPLATGTATLAAIPYESGAGTAPSLPPRPDLPHLPPHRFAAPGQPLSMTDVAILAVLNNPDLRSARNDAGVAAAQAFSASLLPDPVLALSTDFKRHPDPGSSSGYTIGPAYDFGALLTRPALSAAARDESRKAGLALLWQEWQVVAQARLLFIRLVEGAKLDRVLLAHRSYLAERLARQQLALAHALITAEAGSATQAALQDVERQLRDQQRLQNTTRHELSQLLGLAPGLVVPLREEIDLAPPEIAQVRRELQDIATRRPDLLALRYGYAAQDQRYRAAIVAQFPALTVGLTRARDTSNVSSQGFNVSLSLPLFNRNRGNIAIEQATRQKLHDDYQQRLDAARNDVDRILAEQQINTAQLAQLRDAEQQAALQRGRLQRATGDHRIDDLLLASADATLLTRQTESLALELSMLSQRVALQSLLGGELPALAREPD